MKTLLIAAILAASTLFATPASSPRRVNPVQMLQSEDGGAFCTTFAINEKRHLWMTAAHCLQDEMAVYVSGDEVHVAAVDHVQDIAVLMTPTVTAKGFHLQDAPPQYGQPIHIIAYGLAMGSGDQMLVQGTIASPEAHLFDRPAPFAVLDITACKGMSGGPVLNVEGELVSLVQLSIGEACGRPSAGATLATLKLYKALFG